MQDRWLRFKQSCFKFTCYFLFSLCVFVNLASRSAWLLTSKPRLQCSTGEVDPSSFAACCVAACVVLFVVLWEEFADSRAGFRCHPSNTLQKTLLPFHWWCQDEVGPAPSGGMFTWRACCCLCRNKPSLMPRRLLLSKEKNKKQHEWLCSVFCPLKAVICVSVSVINACVPLISPEREQNAKLHFF